MRKALSAILLVVYITLSSGIVINRHYCMNRFDSVAIGGVESEVCGKCGMHTNKSGGCCHDEVKLVKLHVDQQTNSINYTFSLAFETQITQEPTYADKVQSSSGYQIVHINSPPLIREDIYLRNRVVRI